MSTSMLDKLRTGAYALLSSKRGNGLKPVRLARAGAHLLNDFLGRPLAPESELEERKTYDAGVAERAVKAQAEREARQKAEAARAAAPVKEAAPVVVYTDGQSHRDLKRIAEVLRGRDIPWIERSVVEDEATLSWVTTTAKTKELPVVFIAGDCVGGLRELVELDGKGELVRRVFPN
jgi:glutaredoxin